MRAVQSSMMRQRLTRAGLAFALAIAVVVTIQAPALAVAPVVTAISDQTVDEGTAFSGTVADFDDPDGAAAFTATIDWGDGTVDDCSTAACTLTDNLDGTGSVAGDHTYVDDGSFTVTITVNDTVDDGIDTFEMTVANVAPTIVLTGNATVNEGATYSLTLGAVTDPGDETVTAYIVDWGDGTTPESSGTAGVKTHTYTDDATPTISVDLTDEDGTHVDAGTLAITVNNVAPTVNAPATATITEGDTLGSSISFTDPGSGDTHERRVRYLAGDSFGVWAAATSPFNLSRVYDDDTTDTVTIQVRDDDLGQGADSIALTVNNADPVVTARNNVTVESGSPAFLGTSAFTDAGVADTHTATADWDDGTIVPITVTQGAGSGTLSGNHTYAADGVYTVTLEVTDDDGGVHSDTFLVTVANSDFTVTAGSNQSVDEGDTVNVNASFDDTDGAGTHTATINWGDGTTDDCSTVACTIVDAGDGTGTVTGSHVYPDNDGSPWTVTVTVSDETADIASDGFNVTVANVAPDVTLSGNTTVNEGSVYTLTIGAVDDPGTDEVTEWVVDWDDGTAPETFAAGGMQTHTYLDGTITPTITVSLTDEDGTYDDVDSLAITVNNVAPTIALSGAATVDEGSVYTLTLGAVTDPGDDTVTEYRIDWDDGTAVQVVTVLGDVTHTYADGDATPTISVAVVDDDGTHANAGTKVITVTNVAPTITAPATATFAEGGTLASLISFSDPGTDTHEARVDYDEGDGFGGWATETSPFNLNNVFEEDGVYSVAVEIRDSDGAVDSVTIDVTVTNANPVVVARTDDTVNEGATVFIAGGGGTSYTDAGVDDTHTATVDWDEGAGPETATAAGGSVTASSHTYNTPGTFTVTVEVTDDDGGIGTSSFTVNVQNVNLTVTATPDGPTTVDEGDAVTVSATFNDFDGNGTYAGSIDWGDGTVDDCATAACTIVDGGGGTGTVSGGHTYPQDGTFTVSVMVDDGGMDAGTNGFTYTVQNVLPTTNVTGPTTSLEGTQVKLFGNPVDPGVDDVLTYDWVVTKNGDLFKTGTNVNVQVRPDDNGTYEASYTVFDDDGQSVIDVFAWTVENVDPVATIVNADTGDLVQGVTPIGVEGSTITLGADVTDAGAADTFEYAWEITQPGSPPIVGTDPTISFVSPDDGLFFVALTVRDDDGGAYSPLVPIINVINGDPVIEGIVTDATPAVGGTVNLGLTFGDPGELDTHTVTIHWGDGSTDTVNDAVSPVAASHSFPTAGPRQAEVCIEDDDGGSTCATWWYNVGAALLRTADYNGDGYEDLAVGVPGEDAGAGAVHIIYGSSGSLQASDDQFLRQGTGGVVGSKEDGDAFGSSLAHGDFNGDGYADLVVGAPGEDLGGLADVGNVTVIYGSAAGLDVGNDQVWHQDKKGITDLNEADDRFGEALVAGDFNGDAYADLAIGTPNENVGGVVDTGRVTILFGSPSGLRAAGSLVVDQGIGSISNSNQQGDRYGAALASGDYDGDGISDLAIGVPGQKVSGVARAGAVNVLFGTILGFDVDASDVFIRQGTNGVLGVAAADDEFGSVLASGDLNGDGLADLVVGVPSDAVNGKVDAGAVAVLPGSSSGPTPNGDVLFREGANGLEGGPIKFDGFGTSVAVGDVTGDGLADLLIGIPNQKISGFIRAGAAAFIPGSADLGTTGNSRWHEDKSKILGTAQKDDHLGTAVAILDTDGDGNADIALGIPDQNRAGRKDVGAVLVIRGGASGPVKKGDGFWQQGQDGLADGTQKFDRFGGAL